MGARMGAHRSEEFGGGTWEHTLAVDADAVPGAGTARMAACWAELKRRVSQAWVRA